jgi:hypothetical protein
VASIDLSEFDCARCAEAARKGHDLKEPFSGKAKSCEGPREWKFFTRHASGGFTWRGCPRSAMTPRVAELLRAFDACDGRLTYTEQRTAPGVLLDAFRAIAYARGMKDSVEAEESRRSAKPKG